MNKVFSFLFLLVHIPTLMYSQINWGDYSQSFSDGVMDRPENTGLILAIPQSNNSFWTIHEKSIYFDELAKDTSFVLLRPAADIVARTTFDTA